MRMRWICTMILAIWSVIAVASSYQFRSLSVSDGLSDLVVNTLYKDSLGYLWFGTNTSLERFDGVYLKRFSVRGASESLKRVYAVAELPGNEIWAGTGSGLWRVKGTRDGLERIAADMIDMPVKALLSDGKGTLYIGTEKGLFVYTEGRVYHHLLDKNVFARQNSITGLSLDNRTLWITTQKGLAALDLKDKKIAFYDYPQAFNTITRIGKTLYLGTMGKGMVTFDTAGKLYHDYLDVGCPVISSLSSDGKDLLYVGTDGNGVHFISVSQGKTVKSFRHGAGDETGIRSNSVYSVLVDRDGLIWIGYYQLGLDYTLYQSDLFETYKYASSFDTKDMLIRTVTFHDDEKLIGTRDGLFFVDERRRLFKSFLSPQLRATLILSSCYSDGKYYIGTYGGGMYVLDPETLSLSDFDVSEPEPFLNGHVFCMRTDYDGNLWIGTSAGLYCYRNGRQVRHYTTSNSKLPDGNVYEIFFDSTHKGWICTETGMCLWDPSSRNLRLDVFPEGFIHKEKVRMVYEDTSHDLYFLPEKGILFVSDLNMNRFNRVNQPLLNDKSLMAVIEDEKGFLWITTNNGMYRYDKKETCVPYNFTDGIPSQIFINCYPVKDRQGRLWFGNSKGLLCLDMNKVNHLRKHPYKPAVSDVLVDGKEFVVDLLSGKELLLDDGQDNLTFRLSGFVYTDPSNVAYQYKLEGKSEEWIPLLGTSEVSFYNLDSGKYRFRVRRIGYPDAESAFEVRVRGGSGGSLLAGLVLLALFAGGGWFYVKAGKRRRAVRSSASVLTEEVHDVLLEAGGPEKERDRTKEMKASADKYKTNKVSPEECKRLFKLLEHEMQQRKPYQNPDLKIAGLAELIGTSSHVLSYLFNQYLNRNFYDYVNDYRVAEFKALVAKDEYARYTLSALAEICGFSSRASFFRHFKKITGVTPNEYMKQQKR